MNTFPSSEFSKMSPLSSCMEVSWRVRSTFKSDNGWRTACLKMWCCCLLEADCWSCSCAAKRCASVEVFVTGESKEAGSGINRCMVVRANPLASANITCFLLRPSPILRKQLRGLGDAFGGDANAVGGENEVSHGSWRPSVGWCCVAFEKDGDRSWWSSWRRLRPRHKTGSTGVKGGCVWPPKAWRTLKMKTHGRVLKSVPAWLRWTSYHSRQKLTLDNPFSSSFYHRKQKFLRNSPLNGAEISLKQDLSAWRWMQVKPEPEGWGIEQGDSSVALLSL